MRISTHTPLAGRDRPAFYFRIACRFLLTRPLRGATFQFEDGAQFQIDFYSHAPCGARLIPIVEWRANNEFLLTRPLRGATKSDSFIFDLLIFLLTRPLRGATGNLIIMPKREKISTHTPLAGRDMSLFPLVI